MTEEQSIMIDDCEVRESRLSKWECDFIASISECETLSDAQASKLENIWEKATANG